MRRLLWLSLALAFGVALTAHGEVGRAISALRSLAEPLLGHGTAIAPRFDRFYTGMVEALPPQQKVERALELAINDYSGASDYIVEHAQSWRGQFARSEKLEALLSTASSSRRMEVRMAAIEVSLAEYGLEKSAAEVDRLLARREADRVNAGPWALWNVAMIGARGVDRERVFGVLLTAIRDADDKQRTWAVDALARFGGAEVIGPLLDVAAHDNSVVVQERAFCGIAQSGTLQLAERYHAVPGLLAIAENAQASHQQHEWAFQALREITEIYDLPQETAAWRDALGRAGLLNSVAE